MPKASDQGPRLLPCPTGSPWRRQETGEKPRRGPGSQWAWESPFWRCSPTLYLPGHLLAGHFSLYSRISTVCLLRAHPRDDAGATHILRGRQMLASESCNHKLKCGAGGPWCFGGAKRGSEFLSARAPSPDVLTEPRQTFQCAEINCQVFLWLRLL